MPLLVSCLNSIKITMCEDIHNCCRICLDVRSDHVSILGDPTIHLHLKSCLALTISSNDELPKVICKRCVTQLSEFYNFQLNARCSQDWLESSIQEKAKKSVEKTQIQPLPDSEYNSDSLLEFLNNTANIEEYLNNLGKEDIPSIVNLLDRNENAIELKQSMKVKPPTPKKKQVSSQKCMNMEIDVLDSEKEIVKEILLKETEPKKTVKSVGKVQYVCFGCKIGTDNLHKLSQHISMCDIASRTCVTCNMLFDSKQKMFQHSVVHNGLSLICICGKQFPSKDKLLQHHKVCVIDYGDVMGCVYRCKQCGELFKERFQLYRHAKVHILKSDERICDICGHQFNGNDALVTHKKEEHEKDDNLLYRCKVCKFTSAYRKEIYLHVKKHTAIEEPSRHLCESCGRSFATRVTLMRHSSQHDKTDHKCIVCDKRFHDTKTRDEHTLEHVTLIICDRCGQDVNSYNLEKHKCG